MPYTYKEPDFLFTFHDSQWDSFRKGELRKSWRERYPQLFDEVDEKLARNQSDSHFFEWLAAVLFYESTGYLSLQEYILKTHARKRALFESIVPSILFKDLDFDQGGLPDLFLYSPRKRDWFFCEVKGGADRIRANQIVRFAQIHKMTGQRPLLIKLKRFVA
jgi:hypothetical protein